MTAQHNKITIFQWLRKVLHSGEYEKSYKYLRLLHKPDPI